jgi:hypothetical protein
MLKAVEKSSLSEFGEAVELIECFDVATTHFTGIRVFVVGGLAHLIFYTERPTAGGRIEYVVVDRLAAPKARALSLVTDASSAIMSRPELAPDEIARQVN